MTSIASIPSINQKPPVPSREQAAANLKTILIL